MARAKPRRVKTPEEIRMQEVREKAEAIGVPEPQLARGYYDIADVRIDDGERVTTHRTLINRGGTAIERWMHEPDTILFGEPQKGAVRYCQALWQKIDRKGPRGPVAVSSRYIWAGQSEHEALSELSLLKRKIIGAACNGRKLWEVFEDVCRFDARSSDAGDGLMGNARSSSDAAKSCVGFVASMIAMWRGL